MRVNGCGVRVLCVGEGCWSGCSGRLVATSKGGREDIYVVALMVMSCLIESWEV